MYCAIIGDMIRSRGLAQQPRYAVQDQLKDVLHALNREWDDLIEARFLVTLGDEFQVLLKAAWPVMDIIRRIQRELWPVRVRFGVGYGEIYTEIDRAQAIGADGPAFHRARKAIEAVKKAGMESFPVKFRTGEDDELLLDSACMLMDALSSGWSDKQREAVWAMEQTGGTQKAAAASIGRTASSMNTLLHNAKYKAYDAAASNLTAYVRLAYDIRGAEGLSRYNLAAYLLREGDTVAAYRALTAASGSWQDIALLSGRVLLQQGKREAALRAFEAAQSYDDGIPDDIRREEIARWIEEARRT